MAEEENGLSTGMKMLNTFSPYGQIINGAMDIGQSIYNWFDYGRRRKEQQALQQKIWDREDSLIQRRVADAQAAGINPLAALGMGGTAQVVSMPEFNPVLSGTGVEQAALNIESTEKMQERSFEQQVKMWEAEADRIKTEADAQRLFDSIQRDLDRRAQAEINRIQVAAQREKTRKDYEKAMKELENRKNEFAKQLMASGKEKKRELISKYIQIVTSAGVGLGSAAISAQ